MKKSKAKTKLGPRPSPREAGQSLGQGFARLNGASKQRLENISAAIDKGFLVATTRDEMTSELSSDPDFLESMGFGKPR
jgi:hypothetical protein